MMIYLTFLTSLGFLAAFIWYLAAHEERVRRIAGAWAVLLAIATCLFSIFPLDQNIKLGLDLEGGTSYIVALQGENIAESNVNQAIEVIRKRMDVLGGREIIIQPIGESRISVQIPGTSSSSREEDMRQLSRVAKLEFRIVHPQNEAVLAEAAANNGKLPSKYVYDWQIIPLVDRGEDGKEIRSQIVVYRPKTDEIQAGASDRYFSGRFVESASRGFDAVGLPQVIVDMNSEGAAKFGELTGRHINERMAIVLDGEAKSAPSIRARLTDSCTISGGNMTALEAEELASVLENPLENPVTIESVREVDPSLGRDSIESGWRAGLISMVGVILLMVIFYHVIGVIATTALFVNLLILLGLLAQFHFTLTLPGIAGIILTIGMAVDANVLIYERIRDELAAGKTLRQAVDLGFSRAFSAIVDSNITTVIASTVLAVLGTGPLRGFAVTLTLGIVANLFAALVVSRTCFDWIFHYRALSKISMMHLLSATRINFLRFRFIAFAISAVVLAVGGLSLKERGVEAFGVDFTGGDALLAKYAAAPDAAEVRNKLESQGIAVDLLQFSADTRTLSLQTRVGDGPKAQQALLASFPDAKFEVLSLDSIGPRVGAELSERAALALGLGLLGILIYASFRFEWSFAVAATLGQLHDVLITVAILSLIGHEFTITLVGAFLAIAGYSINDKIVIFDRIRESMALQEKGSFYDIINRGLNLCLSRSILTTATTLIAVLALMIFGGAVIHDFSVAMFVGVLAGFFSSHTIAPAIAYWLDAYKERQARKRPAPREAITSV